MIAEIKFNGKELAETAGRIAELTREIQGLALKLSTQLSFTVESEEPAGSN